MTREDSGGADRGGGGLEGGGRGGKKGKREQDFSLKQIYKQKLQEAMGGEGGRGPPGGETHSPDHEQVV